MLYNSRVFKDIYKKKFEVQNSEKRIQNEKMKQKFSFESPSFSSSSFSDSSSSVDNQQQTKNKSKIKTYSKKTTFELHQFDIAQPEKFVPKYRGSVSMVPSSFNTITEEELAAHGVNICIYANQLLRAAFPAMENAAKSILKHHRAKEIDSELMSIKQIITLIDEL